MRQIGELSQLGQEVLLMVKLVVGGDKFEVIDPDCSTLKMIVLDYSKVVCQY